MSSRKITPNDVFAHILGGTEDELLGDDNLQKNDERRNGQEIPELFSTKKKAIKRPSKENLKRWFSHISRLIVDVYIIETKVSPICGRCEKWKHHPFEKKWLYRIHELLGLDEDKVKVHIYPSDWNCLQAVEYKDSNGIIREMSSEIDEYGENYFMAYGNSIGYYPAVVLYLDSTEMKKKSEEEGKKKKSKAKGRSKKSIRHTSDSMEGYEKITFSGIEGRVNKRLKFKIGDKILEEDVNVADNSLLRYILKFLRTLDIKDIPLADNVSALLGQYHRHSRDR